MLKSFDQHATKTLRSQPVSMQTPTDEQLMEMIQGHDEIAIASLYSRHAPLLRFVVAHVLSNGADVDDVIQEVFCEIWRQAAHYSEQKGKALGWIVTLARRRAIDKIRKKQAYARAEERFFAEQTVNPAGNGRQIQYKTENLDRAQNLQRMISTLPIAQQEALKFAFYRGMSHREIAAHTGIPLGTIKTRLELAMRKMRSAILADGGTGEWSIRS